MHHSVIAFILQVSWGWRKGRSKRKKPEGEKEMIDERRLRQKGTKSQRGTQKVWKPRASVCWPADRGQAGIPCHWGAAISHSKWSPKKEINRQMEIMGTWIIYPVLMETLFHTGLLHVMAGSVSALWDETVVRGPRVLPASSASASVQL